MEARTDSSTKPTLRDVRTVLGFSLRYVEKKTKIDRGSLSQYETGGRRPGLDNTLALAEFYNIEPQRVRELVENAVRRNGREAS